MVTNMPFWADKIGVPRTLAVEFPFGHILGEPHNEVQQMKVVIEALNMMEAVTQPGSIFHSKEKWSVETAIALKSWQPLEPSPVIAHMSGKIRENLRKNRKTREN